MPRDVALRLALMQRAIPAEDLYPEKGAGGLEKQPHVTVAYGHEEEDPTPTKEALQDMLAGQGRLDRLSTFDNKDYRVLKFDVDSDALHELNKRLRERIKMPGLTFKEYNPHVTVAYLKPDADVERYRQLERLLKDRTFPVKHIRWRSPSDKAVTLSLAEALEKTASKEELTMNKKFTSFMRKTAAGGMLGEQHRQAFANRQLQLINQNRANYPKTPDVGQSMAATTRQLGQDIDRRMASTPAFSSPTARRALKGATPTSMARQRQAEVYAKYGIKQTPQTPVTGPRGYKVNPRYGRYRGQRAPGYEHLDKTQPTQQPQQVAKAKPKYTEQDYAKLRKKRSAAEEQMIANYNRKRRAKGKSTRPLSKPQKSEAEQLYAQFEQQAGGLYGKKSKRYQKAMRQAARARDAGDTRAFEKQLNILARRKASGKKYV